MRALYTYKPQRDVELAVRKGDVLTLVSKDNADWWRVQLDDQIGFVPANYLKEVPADQVTPALGADAQRAVTPVTQSVVVRQEAIEDQYAQLLQQAAQRRTKLDESQKLFQLNREVDEVESWMNDREAVVSVQDLGTDLEHNEVIQKKFDDFLKDLAANETRVNVANQLARKFVEQGHSDTPVIQQRQKALNDRWARLQDMAAQREQNLARAHAVHKFSRDADETKARFNEKDVVLSSDDYGKDVPSVEALQRKHDGAMRELAALETKVADLRGQAGELSRTHPQDAARIASKLGEIEESWGQLQAKAEDRADKLESSLQLQKFLGDFRDLGAWVSTMQNLASSDELARDASGAEALVKRQQELRTEIDARLDNIKAFRATAAALKQNGHYAAGEIDDKVQQLDQALTALDTAMAARKAKIDQCVELQAFNRLAEQAEAWISTREAPLTTDDVGSSLDAVEALQKKHADFEKSLAAQKEKIAEVEREAERLAKKGHYDAPNITKRREAVKNK